MYSKLFKDRTESARYAKPYFDASKTNLKYGSYFQWLASILTILNIIITLFVQDYPISVALQFIILFIMIGYKIFMYRSRTFHNKGERIRRTSFWINYIPDECIIDDIDSLLGKKDESKDMDNYYSSDSDSKLVISFYKDFLESAVFQSELMKINKKQLEKQFLILIIISIGTIFIVWMMFPYNLTIGSILALCSIATISIIIDEAEKIWLNIRYTKKVGEIKTKLQTLLSRCEWDEHFIYECMRLQMEYSIIMNKIIPIPEKVFEDNQETFNKKFNDIMKDLELKLSDSKD